jgi:hypothetical protein
LLKLDSLLKAMSHRLARTKNPDKYEVKYVTFAEKVRPFPKRLRVAYSGTSEQIALVKRDRRKLDWRHAEVGASHERLQKEVEEHDKLTAMARKRETAARLSGEDAVQALSL